MKNSKRLDHLLPSEILANVSHELRSPLASIKGYTGTLLRHEQHLNSEERREMLAAIDDASNRMAQLLDRFFELSQLEMGSIALAPTIVDIPSLLQMTIMEMQERLSTYVQNHYTFSISPALRTYDPAHSELCVWGDQQRLKEVFDHLLENAVLYSPGGDIQITIYQALESAVPTHSVNASSYCVASQHQQDGAGQEWAGHNNRGVEICISDQGIGIPDEALDRVFERFYRADMRLVRETNGLGLGLTICKSLVQLHGGHIWVKSEPKKGSTFYVWLPLYTQPKDD
ncbi:MAG TPA: HAMP domain-containing sensor histidine kinase [Ktedonobacteraceae bacterium]